MNSVVTTKGLLLLVMGVALLSIGGCMGGDKNFTPSVSAAPVGQPGAPVRVAVGTRIGNQAPDFTLKSLDGATVRLSDFRGKPVLVNFWATWCPPCQQEMPDIENSYQKHKDDVVFLGIDMKEDPNTVRSFVQGRYSWTFLLDPDQKSFDAFYVTGVPESYFIDRDGIVRDSKIGAMTGPELESKLAKIE